MKNIKTFIIIVFSILNFSACNTPEPIDQDETMLWLANGRSYKEVLASVETRIDSTLSKEEYHIYDANGKRYIDGGSQAAIRYGVYALQRAEVLGKADAGLDIHEKPYYEYRILNHWDNLDDTVERGYAGLSMWEWTAKEIPTERIHHYGELCASVGLNGAVLNNVNANPLILDKEHIERVAQIANILREYGITTYLSIKWTSPVTLDGLKSGDPLDPKVRQWWKNKAAEIYTAIPDFGGFLVKANSEGQAGPQDYGRTHADGANMLAEAVAPYGGIIMWRAFVYNPTSSDRANQAVEEFKSLDGQFADNVIIQIKNGPIDFQPREPFSPLFGQLYNTPMMMEFQITQEYLGFSNHLVYHGTTYEECLDSDTYRDGKGSTIAKMVKAIAGVANTGQDPNFCGYIFAQSNWYAFGRLAWDPTLSAEQIANEWIHQTFIKPKGITPTAYEQNFLIPVKDMMMSSRETAVNYMMPLGFHHLPWDYKLSSGRELWDEICLHYDKGISQVEEYKKMWAKLKPYVSESIFNEVSEKLDIQKNDAEWWRDACVGYFQTFSNKELPAGVRPLNIPIDSLMNSRVKSNRYGMPYHDENHKPIIIKRL